MFLRDVFQRNSPLIEKHALSITTVLKSNACICRLRCSRASFLVSGLLCPSVTSGGGPGRRTQRGMQAQARPLHPGVRQAVLRPHVDHRLVGQGRLGPSSHQTVPEPVAAPCQLSAALLHRGEPRRLAQRCHSDDELPGWAGPEA